MTQGELNFESESLVVDYISLNISGSVDLKPIAKYLFKQCHFNSMINSAGREKRLYYENTNQHRVSFRPQEYNPDYKSFWHGTQMIFKGDNAAQFYKLIKAQKFQWNILNLEKIKIGRFDINYFLSDELLNQNNLVEDFFFKSRERALADGVHATSDSKILKIGHRKSPNYYRVYLKEKVVRKSVYDQLVYGLEFELELKGNSIKKFERLLFLNSLVDIQKFENHLSHHFLRYSLTRLDLTTSCTYWLLNSYRKKLREKKSDHFLVTDYLRKTPLENFAEKESLFRLFQVLAFVRAEKIQPQKEEFLVGQTYFAFEFPLYEYLRFIGMDALGGKGQARRQKVKEGLLSLYGVKPLVIDFSSDEFESHPIIGGVKVRKKGKFLMVGISIAKLLYNYQYPFVLPTSFLCYKNRYDLHVKIEILRAFCSRDIKKQINLENFLKQFSVPNRQVKQIKILLLKGLHELQQFIQPSFVITKKNGNLIETKQLTLRVIKQARIISFKEAIKISKFNTQYFDPSELQR